MNLNLTNRDAYALVLATGIKLGGGSWQQALLWGMGARLIMRAIGFPEMQPLETPAQNILQDVGGFVGRVFGRPDQETVQQQDQQQPYSQAPAASGPVIDAEYESYGYQT